MKVQVVSYKSTLRRETKRALTEALINDSEADLILFPGWTLNSEEDVRTLKIKNKKITTVIDIKTTGATEQYLVQNGKIAERISQQVFTTSKEATIENVEALLDTIQEKPRRFEVQNKNCLLLVCGETNILYKPTGGTIRFRYPKDKDLNVQFNETMRQTDIILNPMHSPWRRHVDLNARIKFLSRGRYYFGTSNTSKKISLNARLIYAFYNGKELDGRAILSKDETRYKSKIYEI